MNRELVAFMIALIFIMVPVAGCLAGQAEVVWHDATEFDIEGRGWSDVDAPYDRFPARAKATVPEEVWNLSKHSAGLCVRFRTRSLKVSVRWTVNSDSLAMPHMPATGVSGVDLYRRADDGPWRFVANGRPEKRVDNLLTATLPGGAAETECLLYLPLYNGVQRLEIGVPRDAVLERAASRLAARRRPIAYYGTSIVQGGCASRPGMAHVAILGRMLDRPMINLGFSGSGRMDPAVSQLLSELNPCVYVIDCLRNMGGLPDDEIAGRVKTLVEILRKAHPSTPILFVGRSEFQSERPIAAIERLQDKVVNGLKESGIPGLYLCPGSILLGVDGDGTVDGSHPNDLGMRRQADALAPILRRLLRKSPSA